jgi:hypothetical protein
LLTDLSTTIALTFLILVLLCLTSSLQLFLACCFLYGFLLSVSVILSSILLVFFYLWIVLLLYFFLFLDLQYTLVNIRHAECVQALKASVDLLYVFLWFSWDVGEAGWENRGCTAGAGHWTLTRSATCRVVGVFGVGAARVLAAASREFFTLLFVGLQGRVDTGCRIFLLLAEARLVVVDASG